MIQIPQFKNVPMLEAILKAIVRDIENLRGRTVSKETANHSIILQAPDSSTWEVKVNPAGGLTTTKLSG